MDPASSTAAYLATLALTLLGFSLIIGARRLAGGFAIAAFVAMLFAAHVLGPAIHSILGGLSWWIAVPLIVVVVGLLGIGALQLFVRIFLGKSAASTMAGFLARDLMVGVLLFPFWFFRILISLATMVFRRREPVRRVRM